MQMQGNILGMADFMKAPAAPQSAAPFMPPTASGAPPQAPARPQPPQDPIKMRSRQLREQLRARIMDTTDPMRGEVAKQTYMAEMRKLLMSQPQPDLGIFSRQ